MVSTWLKVARKNFVEFPEDVQSDMLDALTIAAGCGKSDKAKPLKGVDGGVFEIALQYRGDAFRTLYAVKIGADINGSSMLFRRNQNQGSKHRKWRSILFVNDLKT